MVLRLPSLRPSPIKGEGAFLTFYGIISCSMKKIYIIGDMDTVSAFRLSGVEGVVSARDDAPLRLEEVLRKGAAGIVMVTSDLAGDLQERITQVNLAMEGPVVIEVPGIDETEGPRRSVVGYIAEALGISLES